MVDIFELIRQKCPDGVRWDKIKNVTKIYRGIRVVKDNLFDAGYPVYQNSLTPMGYMDSANRDTDTVFLICAGAAGDVGFSRKAMWAADDCYCFKSDKLDQRFLYYCLVSQVDRIKSFVRDGAVPRLAALSVGNLFIPCPPLQIQREIVAILDKFDAYCNSMTAGLAGELEMRRKQYRYWRDKIFQDLLDEGCEMKAIGELGKFDQASGIKKDELLSEGMPCLHYGQVYTTYDIEFKEPVSYVSDDTYAVSAKARHGDVVVTLADTADLGFVGKAVAQVSGVDVAISMHAGIIRLDPAEMDAKFLAYYMDTHKFWMQKDRCKVGTSIIGIRVPLWQKIKVPVPDMARQREIVEILDKFRELECELECELELRRKQYGYYRDILLAFPEQKGA